MNKMKAMMGVGCALCAFPSTLCAADDFGIWTEAEVTKSLNPQWTVGVEGDFRTMDHVKHVDRWSAGVSVGYKPFKFLNFDAGYNYLYSYRMGNRKESYKGSEDDPGYVENDDTWNGYNYTHAAWYSRHRFSFSATGKYKLGRFSFSLRERLQFTHQGSMTLDREKYRFQKVMVNGVMTNELKDGYPVSDPNHEAAEDVTMLRSRLKTSYNIRHCAFTPYASVEFFNELNDGGKLDKTRFSVGTDYKMSKQCKLSLGYMYQTKSGDDGTNNLHALVAGVSVDL